MVWGAPFRIPCRIRSRSVGRVCKVPDGLKIITFHGAIRHVFELRKAHRSPSDHGGDDIWIQASIGGFKHAKGGDPMLIPRPVEQDQIARERTLDPGVAQVGLPYGIPSGIVLGHLQAGKLIMSAPEPGIRKEDLMIPALDGNDVLPNLGSIHNVGKE